MAKLILILLIAKRRNLPRGEPVPLRLLPEAFGRAFVPLTLPMVLLGGVSIFGGSGNLVGVGLSILVILNLRNGMGLANITGNAQTSVIGALLIPSVLVPNMAPWIHNRWRGREA